jgi:major membrane immunogen (membrane-anchored lipoprotein)
MRAMGLALVVAAALALGACGESKTVRELRATADRAEAHADDAEQKAAELQARIDTLDKRVTALETDDSDDDPTVDRQGASAKVGPRGSDSSL